MDIDHTQSTKAKDVKFTYGLTYVACSRMRFHHHYHMKRYLICQMASLKTQVKQCTSLDLVKHDCP